MLKKIKNVLFSKYFLLSLVAVAIFSTASFYVYTTHIKPRIDEVYKINNEYTNSTENMNKTAELYYFYVTWCPHCKKASPIISQLKKYLENNKINGVTVIVRQIDCDKDKVLANKYKIDGYPTIKLMSGKDIYHYDANPEINTLKEFLSSSLHN